MGPLSQISLINQDGDKLWQDVGAKSVSFFCLKRPVKVDSDLIVELKQLSQDHNGKNVRLCLHESPKSDHHDMVILERRGKYYRPHRHDGKGEAFHIIEGQMGLFAFDDKGTVIDASLLNPGDIYRVAEGGYHAVLPITETVIYHENKPGPFTGEGDSIYPNWAPDGADEGEIDEYVQKLTSILK